MMGEDRQGIAGQAVVSLTVGILGVCAWFIPLAGLIFGIVAIGFGILGESLIRKSAGQLKGEGLVWTGLILGIASVVVAVLMFCITRTMLGLLFPCRVPQI